MAEIIEVIHRINYEINDGQLQNAVSALHAQIRELDNLQKALTRYQQQLTRVSDTSAFNELTRKAENATRAIEAGIGKTKGIVEQFGSGMLKGLGLETNIEGAVAKWLKPLSDHLDEVTKVGSTTKLSLENVATSLTSVTSVIPLALGLVAALAQEFAKVSKDAQKAEENFQNFLNTIKDGNREMRRNIDTQKVDLSKQLGILNSGRATPAQKNEAYSVLQQQYAFLQNITKEDFLRKNMVKTIEAQIEAQEKANGIQKLIVEGKEYERQVEDNLAKDKEKVTAAEAKLATLKRKRTGTANGDNIIAQAEKELAAAKQRQVDTQNHLNGLKVLEKKAQDEVVRLTLIAQPAEETRTKQVTEQHRQLSAQSSQLSAQKEHVKEQQKSWEEIEKNIKAITNGLKEEGVEGLEQWAKEIETITEKTKQLRDERLGPPVALPGTGVVDPKHFDTSDPAKQKMKDLEGKMVLVTSPAGRAEIEENERIAKRRELVSSIRETKNELQKLNEDPETNADAIKVYTGNLKELKNQLADVDAERKKQLKGLISDVVSNTAAALQNILDMQAKTLDGEIALREKRVAEATELAKRGNTEMLDAEKERLQKAQEEREKVAKKQLQLNALLQASSYAIAAVQAIQTVTNSGANGDPYTAAIRIAAAVAALAAGFAAVTSLTSAFKQSSSFADGVVGFQGVGGPRDDANWVRISSGESVITAKGTAANRSILEAINSGTEFRMLNGQTLMPAQTTTGAASFASKETMKTLEKKLDGVIEAVKDSRLKQDIFFNEHGVGLMTQRVVRRDQNRFK